MYLIKAIQNILLILSTILLTNIALAFDTSAPYAIIIDYDTNQVLYEKQADTLMHPSSMTKMMTTYIVFDYLKDNKITKDQIYIASQKAGTIGGSSMFIGTGNKATIDELLYGAIVQSGNDACVVLAENISGNEETFVQEMNQYAKKLNLSNTKYDNCAGMPSVNNMTTARDLARLAGHVIRDFPEQYYYHSVKEWSFNNINQPNRNASLGFYGIDGVKTGHTDAGGYGITVSAAHDGRRIIAVVNGLNSPKELKQNIESMVEHGFKGFNKYQYSTASQPLAAAKVWYGDKDSVNIGTAKDVSAFLEKGTDASKLRAELNYTSPLLAPIVVGDPVGTIKIYNGDNLIAENELIALEAVGKANYFRKIWYNIRYVVGLY